MKNYCLTIVFTKVKVRYFCFYKVKIGAKKTTIFKEMLISEIKVKEKYVIF